MKIEDYSEYYIQGSDHYLIPEDEFVELFEEIKELESVLELYENGVYFSSEVDEKDKIIDELKDNWNKLKQKIIDSFNKTQDVWFIDILQEIEKIEQGSDSNE